MVHDEDVLIFMPDSSSAGNVGVGFFSFPSWAALIGLLLLLLLLLLLPLPLPLLLVLLLPLLLLLLFSSIVSVSVC